MTSQLNTNIQCRTPNGVWLNPGEVLCALLIAYDAMRERRKYASDWEYKYGSKWDEEDAEIQNLIKSIRGKK